MGTVTGMVAYTCNSKVWRLRQEDGHELETSLGYVWSSVSNGNNVELPFVFLKEALTCLTGAA